MVDCKINEWIGLRQQIYKEVTNGGDNLWMSTAGCMGK